jgi:PAS domain S-box-containing protein
MLLCSLLARFCMELPVDASSEWPEPSQQPALGPHFMTGGLLDALPCGVLVLDEQQVIQGANLRAAQWCGAAPEALLGRPLAEAGVPAALAVATQHLLATEDTVPLEVWLAEPRQWLALSASRQPSGWVLCGQDITPQKQREQHYQTLAENTPDVLTRWDADLRLRYANDSFADKAGHPMSALLGRTFGEMVVAPDVTVPYMAALQRAFDTGQPQEHYHFVRTPHGTESCYSRLVPELRDGRVETVLGVAHDITALQQSQTEALRFHGELVQRATDKYHALFYTMDQGFCVLEILFDEPGQRAVDFRYLELNPVFAQQSGMPADALGKTARELLPDLDPFWFDTYSQVVRTGEPVRVEHYVPQLSRWVDVHAFRVGEPEAHQVAVLFNNITARKQAEEQLRLVAATKTFRLQLADALGALADPAAIQEAVTSLTRAHFAADRCAYYEVENGQVFAQRDVTAEGLGACPLAEVALLQAASEPSQPFIVPDVRQEKSIDENLRQHCVQQQVIAYLAVPVLKNGEVLAVLCLVQHVPREWATEVSLAAEVAERAWAAIERAKAKEALRTREVRYRADLERQVQERTAELQQSRDLLQATMDSTLDMIQVFEAVRDEAGHIVDFRWLLNNHTSVSRYGEVQGQSLLERNPGVLQEGIFADFLRVVETGEPQQVERYYDHEQFKGWFLQSVVKLGDGVATSTKEVSEWKKAQVEILRLRLRQQQDLFEAVQAAQEAERRRIAEGLHNGIGQILYATKLRLDQLHPVSEANLPAWQPAYRDANHLLSEAIRQTRALSHELVPLVLEEFGLAAALQDICYNVNSPQFYLQCQVQVDADTPPLSAALQLALYRIAQELAQNIVKHARSATEASLELEIIPGWVLLRVEDNGPGFATLPATDTGGLGLRSIRDRVALLGGVIQTGTLPRAGAYVRIRIPVAG